MGLVWEEKTSELPAVQGRKRPLFPCWPSTTYLIKSLSVFGGSNGISEVATAIGFWDSPMCWHSAGGRYFDKPPIQTTSVPVYLVNIEWGQYVQIPRASVKLLVTYFMYTPLCKVYVSKYYQAGYIHKHPTNLTGHPILVRCGSWDSYRGRMAVVIFRL